MKNSVTYLLLIIGAIVIFTLFFSKEPGKKETANQTTDKTTMPEPTGKYSAAPKLSINPNKTYTAEVQTSQGNLTINLFAKDTPNTVNNFVFLAKEKFYDGVVFHRIIKDFMIQTGDPAGNGTGGPGYKFDDEKISKDYKRGIVAMANSGPNTNGSQFFIMTKDTDLPKNYVIFGEVTKGLETIDKIASVEVEDSGFGEVSKPKQKVSLNSVTISEK